jgi:hypothetical protein
MATAPNKLLCDEPEPQESAEEDDHVFCPVCGDCIKCDPGGCFCSLRFSEVE